jgi:hypothetical protein
MTRPGDTLTCSGEMVKEYDGEDGPLVDAELSCARQAGEVAVQAWGTFARPEAGREGPGHGPDLV